MEDSKNQNLNVSFNENSNSEGFDHSNEYPPFPYFPRVIPIRYNNINGNFFIPIMPPPQYFGRLVFWEFGRFDDPRSQELVTFIENEGLVPSLEEENKRQNAIDKLKEIVMEWIKTVSHQGGISLENNTVSATVLTYGSYGLGVHNSESDIDALCVGPSYATLEEDFFVVLRDMLTSRPEVSEVHCIKDAKVPLMRFKLDGISIDLPYAQLKVNCVPENVDILNPVFLKNIDDTSWRSLSGVHANKCILRFVPNLEAYQSFLRCIKLWAKKRGVYGNLFGFFGGVHLAILTAYICQRYPNANLANLVISFFQIYSSWYWVIPVSLVDGMPQMSASVDARSFISIRLPCRPHEFCHSNITHSTFDKIRQELFRGNSLCMYWLKPDFDWASLFKAFSYTSTFTRFVKICLSASDKEKLGEWTCLIKSRFRTLLIKLEAVQGYCDPSPTEHVDPSISDPHVVYYWGLQPGSSQYVDIRRVREYFFRSVCNNNHGHIGKIYMSVVKVSQLLRATESDTDGNKNTETN